MNKKAEHSLTGIKFILNVIAVIIIVFGLRAIVDNTTQGILYSGNQEYLIKLNYILFSQNGILPDRYTLDLNVYQNKINQMNIDDIGIEFNLNYNNKNLKFYLNERYYQTNYPLREFNSFMYSSEKKIVRVLNGTKSYVGYLDINYIFEKEKTPTSVNKNE